ncbi:MAG: glycosyltransferase family 4 protein [Candidatus Aenigmarchaeota archaeon]|nr:glycosyltransferase family 4 protein [Candidatus Aenigmarchaeota archaeon]
MKFSIISYNFIGGSTGYYHFGKDILIGGGEVYLYYLVKFLSKEGHDVHIIQTDSKEISTNLDNVTIHGVKMPFNLSGDKGLINRYVFFNLLWKKADAWKNSDRIHFHDYLNAFPHGDNRMTGMSMAINWDDPRYAVLDSLGLKMRFYRDYVRFLAKYAIKNLKKVVSIDRFFFRFVQSEMPEYRDKIEVILNFVDTDLFNSRNNGRSLRSQYGNDRTVILFPRNFGLGRGGLELIKAVSILVKKYPDVLLLMTGEGPEKPLAEKIVKENRLANNVKFIGHVDHFKDMPKLFAAADIVVVPTLSSEATSLACLEAMATKKPVVVTNVGGLPDIVTDGFNGLVAKPHSKYLAEKLESYILDKKLRQTLANTGYKWVKKYHNYKLWCNQYKQFFDI